MSAETFFTGTTTQSRRWTAAGWDDHGETFLAYYHALLWGMGIVAFATLYV